MILSIASCLKNWSERMAIDFDPISHNQFQNANSTNTAARRSLLDLATQTELKLISTLKQYFPLVIQLFGGVGMKTDIALSFLSRWPTLVELQRAKANTVRAFCQIPN